MTMTREDWLQCGDPNVMLQHVKLHKMRDRAFLLFSVACCRRIWHMLTEEPSQRAIEFTEQYVEGELARDKVEAALEKALQTSIDYERYADQELRVHGYYYDAKTTSEISSRRCAANVARLRTDVHSVWNIAHEAATAAAREAIPDSARPNTQSRVWNSARDVELANQCDLIRDIFGYPFESFTFEDRWRGGDVGRIAATIYREQRFDEMPILADALEENGCYEESILAHCREEFGHVRGCWVLDLILKKT